MLPQKTLPFHNLNIDKVILETDSDLSGLSQNQVIDKQEKFGYNELTEAVKESYLQRFLRQFYDPLVILLLVVIVVSFGLGKVIDSIVIFVVVFVNAFTGFVQELKAQTSINSLKNLIVASARVVRDNNISQIASRDLVVGDILLLEEGDRIPADCRLIECKNFTTAEASLTGESYTIPKNTGILSIDTDLADKKNMAWSGTFVASGTAKGVVTNTGNMTEVGRIASEIQSAHTDSEFTKKIGKFGLQVSFIAVVFATVNFIVAWYFGGKLEDNILYSIGSLVSGIPEGLPVILTLVLTIGANKMASHNAIVGKLDATETIGSVNIIATDKTGTLTQNSMTVNCFETYSQAVNIEGDGWSFKGDFLDKDANQILPDSTSQKLLQISTLCCKAVVEKIQEDGKEEYKVMGDPTEASLYVLAQKAGLTKSNLTPKYAIIEDFAFDSNLKMRGTLVNHDLQRELLVVGASEKVIAKCKYIYTQNGLENISDTTIENWNQKTESHSKNGNRVLAIAYRELPKEFDCIETNSFENLILVGIVVLSDPLRVEVVQAVQDCKNAGIRVIMMTGDHKLTALSIAKDAGIVGQDCQITYSEQDLVKMTQEEFEQATIECNVFARCTPERKLLILKTLQSKGQIVAMTGDGVNDGPALKQANVGIAMGKSGTDIARESSQIILADDNFATIIKAVKEGRVIFSNIQKACNISLCRTLASMSTLLLITIFTRDIPFASTQLLWLNLITETIIGIAIAFERGSNNQLGRQNFTTDIISKDILPFTIINAVVMTAVTTFVYVVLQNNFPVYASTGAFVVLYLSQFWNLLNFRSITKSLFAIGIFGNKAVNIGFGLSIVLQVLVMYSPLAVFLKFQAIPLDLLLKLAIASSIVLVVGEAYKFLFKTTTN